MGPNFSFQVWCGSLASYSGSTASLVAEYGVTDALFLNNCQAAVSLCGSLESRALS